MVPRRLSALLGACFLGLTSFGWPGLPVTAAKSDEGPAPVLLEVGPNGVQRAEVILDSYSYTPNHLIVQAGKPVELTLVSVTFLTPHNFILDAPEAGFKLDLDVGAGKRLTVRFTPAQPGTFPFYCDKKLLFFPSHREEGMEGLLEVR